MRIGLVFWGFVLVLLSGLMALEAMNIAVENAWTLIWPLLLIVVGISILYSTLLSWREAQFANHPHLQTIPLGTATSARIRIEHGSGRLNLSALSTEGPSDVLLTGTFGGGLRHHAQQVGGLLNVEMQPEVKRVVPVPWGSGDDLDWSFQLNPTIPLILDIELGPAADTIDLSGLQVTDLRIKTSTSPCQITFPSGIPLIRATIEVGGGGVKLNIPTAVSARIRTEGGLAGIQIDETRFPRDGAYHKSPDYDVKLRGTNPPEFRLDLEIQVGMGSLTIL